MTDEQIVKALDAPYNRKWVIAEDGKGDFIRVGDVIDIINRQKAEIEKLNEEVDKWKSALKEGCAMSRCINKGFLKAEAIKEFAERLKQRQFKSDGIYETEMLWSYQIDEALEEMTEKGGGEE